MDHDVFWLRDLLPKEVPHARVLTYGYDSSPAKLLGSASTSMVHHHATDLVSELHHFRRVSFAGVLRVSGVGCSMQFNMAWLDVTNDVVFD